MTLQSATEATAEFLAEQTGSIAQLGKQIMAEIAAGEKAKAKAQQRLDLVERARRHADDMFIAAGLRLIEAQKSLPDHCAFQVFLRDHCGGLSQSRAYEYIAMAEGRTTADETRAAANDRKRRHRAKPKAASVRSTTTGTEKPADETVSAAPASDTVAAADFATDAVAEIKRAVDKWLPLTDNAGRREIAAYVAARTCEEFPMAA